MSEEQNLTFTGAGLTSVEIIENDVDFQTQEISRH